MLCVKGVKLYLRIFTEYFLTATSIVNLACLLLLLYWKDNTVETYKVLFVIKIICSLPIYYIIYNLNKHTFLYYYNLNVEKNLIYIIPYIFDIIIYISIVIIFHKVCLIG